MSADQPRFHWTIVGGSDKGGILVREGSSLKSKAEAERLSTGAIVQELELSDGRLHYDLVSGSGPKTGWISTKASGSHLAVQSFPHVQRLWTDIYHEIEMSERDPAALCRTIQEMQAALSNDYTGRLQTELGNAGFLATGIKAMTSYPKDAQLQANCGKLLEDTVLFHQKNSIEAGKSGYVQAICSALKNHPENRDVQTLCSALSSCCDLCEENNKIVLAAGGIELIMKVGHNFPNDEHLMFKFGCALSCTVASNPQACERVLQLGSWKMMMDLMKLHSSQVSGQVVSETMMVIKVMQEANRTPETLKTLAQYRVDLAEAGAVETFVLAMRDRLRDHPAQANGASCIRYTADGHKSNKAAFVEAGALDLLVASLREHTRCDGICWGLHAQRDNIWPLHLQAGAALAALAGGSKEHQTLMVKAGVIEHLSEAMEKFPNKGLDQLQPFLNMLKNHHDKMNAEEQQPQNESFEGSWIMNSLPGVCTISKNGDVYTLEIGGSLTEATVNGDVLTLTTSHLAGHCGALSPGQIAWNIHTDTQWIFYRWRGLKK